VKVATGKVLHPGAADSVLIESPLFKWAMQRRRLERERPADTADPPLQKESRIPPKNPADQNLTQNKGSSRIAADCQAGTRKEPAP